MSGTTYQPLAGSAPVTPRTLRTRYALWLSIASVFMAFCTLCTVIVRFNTEYRSSNSGFEDPFTQNVGSHVLGLTTLGRKGSRPLLIAEEDLTLEQLAAVYGDKESKIEKSVLDKLKDTASQEELLANLMERAASVKALHSSNQFLEALKEKGESILKILRDNTRERIHSGTLEEEEEAGDVSK